MTWRSTPWSARSPSAATARAPSRSAARAGCRRRNAANATSRRCISSIPRGHLQQASARARTFAGQRLAAPAGFFVPDRRQALRGQERRRCGEGRARRSEMPDGQPQCRRRHPRADRPAARRVRARPATPTSRARTMRWRRRSRRAAPTGASRSSRWRSSTSSLHCGGAGGLRLHPRGRAQERPAVQAFLAALHDKKTKERIRALGMQPFGRE